MGEEAVGCAGEPVMQGAVGEFQLSLTATGHVLELQDHPWLTGVRDHDRAGKTAPEVLAVGREQSPVDAGGVGVAGDQPLPPFVPRQTALDVDDLLNVHEGQLLPAPADHPLQCLVGDEDGARGAQHGAADGGVLESDAPLLLGGRQLAGGGEVI